MDIRCVHGAVDVVVTARCSLALLKLALSRYFFCPTFFCDSFRCWSSSPPGVEPSHVSRARGFGTTVRAVSLVLLGGSVSPAGIVIVLMRFARRCCCCPGELRLHMFSSCSWLLQLAKNGRKFFSCRLEQKCRFSIDFEGVALC